MAFSSRRNKTGGRRASGASAADLMSTHDQWDAEEKPARDWKKIALMIGLGALSWVATYIGMLELIQANMGDLPLTQKMVIGFAVAMLMLMIVWLLDQLFAAHNLFTKLSYVGGYLFLTLISVGFGFGFYWKVLESRSEATRSAESAISQVQAGLHGASTRVSQLQTTLDGLMVISAKKAIEERGKGTSCPNSSPGDGPRRKLRDDDAARFGFASQFIKARADSINGNIKALNVDLQQVIKGAKSTFDAKTGTRNAFMGALNRKLNLTVTGFNAFRSDPQLRQIRSDLADRSTRTVFPNGKGGTFSCPDAQLQAALRGVVRAIDQLPDLQKPKISAVEGSEAVIEAFRRLTATIFGALQFKLPPTPEDLRELQQKAVQSMKTTGRQAVVDMDGAGLSKRDYVPLAIAIFVDLCLLLVSMGRQQNRLENLVPKMRRAERGPVIQILSRFNEIHKDPEIRQNFEIFRHVVFDWGGDYYVAVPMDAPYTADRYLGGGRYERVNTDVEDLRQEAHLLANLFSSFEQEKIFSRVLVPLLSTKAIQKKLHRQGSKFAGASSFRVYKFRNGAWSEIILGAVMGAAKRVEQNKQRRQIEAGEFETAEPAFAEPALNADEFEDESAADAQDAVTQRQEEILQRMEELAAQVAGRHDASGDVAEDAAIAATAGADMMSDEEEARQRQWAERPVKVAAIDGMAVSGFGPYSAHAAAELSAAPLPHGAGHGAGHGAAQATRPAVQPTQPVPPVQAGAANNNTAPDLSMAPINPAVNPDQAVSPAAVLNPAPNATFDQADQDASANVIRLPGNVVDVATQVKAPAMVTPVTMADQATTPAPIPAPATAPAMAPIGQQDRVNVEMRERTVTYTIPAQDAALPTDLMNGRQPEPAKSLISALATQSLPEITGQTDVPQYFTMDDAPLADAGPLHDASVIQAALAATEATSVTAEREIEGLDFAPIGDDHGTLAKDEQIIEPAPISDQWHDEAGGDIKLSEISRRFAHSVKKD